MSDFVEENQTCPTTKCCKKPTVTAGRYICDGIKNGQCVFTISQDICVEVPVEFGAVAAVGDTYVACNGASADEICPDCALNDATVTDPPVSEDTTVKDVLPELP